jgi:hypothetical protein
LVAPHGLEGADLAQVAAEGGLGDVDAPVAQEATQLFLAADGLALEDLGDDLLASDASGHSA